MENRPDFGSEAGQVRVEESTRAEVTNGSNDSALFEFLHGRGLRGAPGYSLEQAHHLPIEMDSLVGE